MDGLVHLLIVLCVLLVAWFITERFSPDPLVTKIVQIILFVIALIVVLRMVLPLAGVSF
jgi:hypothetical protein